MLQSAQRDILQCVYQFLEVALTSENVRCKADEVRMNIGTVESYIGIDEMEEEEMKRMKGCETTFPVECQSPTFG